MSVGVVAFGMLVPACCHWYAIGVGPTATALRVTVEPGCTVWLVGGTTTVRYPLLLVIALTPLGASFVTRTDHVPATLVWIFGKFVTAVNWLFSTVTPRGTRSRNQRKPMGK